MSTSFTDFNYLNLPVSVMSNLRKSGIVIKGFDNRRTWDIKTMEEMYLLSPHIRMIMNAKFNACANVRFRMFQKGTDEDKEIFEHPILELLKNPNPLQDGGSLVAQRMAYQDIWGKTYLRSVNIRQDGFTEKTKALWNLPSNLVTPKIKNNGLIDIYSKFSADEIIDYYEFMATDGNADIQPEFILMYSDFMFNFQTDTSDFIALKESAKNLLAITESRGEVIKHRGAEGMLSPKIGTDGLYSVVKEDDVKAGILGQLKRWYGNLRGQSRIMNADVPMDWVSMTSDMNALRLDESQMSEFNTCCDLLSVPRALFDDKSTYENKKQAEVKMYQDTIIPWSEGDAKRLTKKFNLTDTYITYDYTHLPIMQESETERTAADKTKTETAILKLDKGIIDLPTAKKELGY